MPLREQAAEDVSFSIKHSHPASYNENGKVKIGALLYSRMVISTIWEIMFVFIGLPGLSGE
ncbi:MAG: hypothetical protein WCA19_09865 [Candidatus Acidiferrales bacterium]